MLLEQVDRSGARKVLVESEGKGGVQAVRSETSTGEEQLDQGWAMVGDVKPGEQEDESARLPAVERQPRAD